MLTVPDFFANIAFVQLLMCGLLLAPAWPGNRSARLFTLLMVSGCGYIAGSLFGPFEHASALWWLHRLTSDALAGVFWLVSLSVFSDRSPVKPWQYAVASLTLLIPLAGSLPEVVAGADLAAFPALQGLIRYGAMALELVLISHAIVVAAAHWQSDLVQHRRYMRVAVIGLTATYLFIVIVLEQVFGLGSDGLETFKYVALSVLMLGIYRLLFTLREDSLLPARAEQSPEVAPRRKTGSPELQRIIDAMTVEQLYHDERMTISALSRHLSIHEYKLRQLINGELGYRNFNDFLNHYRINEVAEKLADPEHHETTVLTLALESGFRSLSSFNRAFKSMHGMTPTQYRSQAHYRQAPASP